MQAVTRILIISLVIAVSVVLQPTRAAPTTSSSEFAVPLPPKSRSHPTSGVSLERYSPSDAALLERALERFETAGLQLPATMEINFHLSTDGCAGYQGLHTHGSAGPRIDICVTIYLAKERILMHELAHAWAVSGLTDEERQTFLELRGLEVWNNAHTDWNMRGTEQSAEIIRWGLAEYCVPPKSIPEHDLHSLMTAFIHLTGMPELCQAVTRTMPAREPGITE